MDITRDLLLAKFAGYKQAAEQHKALADANFGAAQAIEELLQVEQAVIPKDGQEQPADIPASLQEKKGG